jgi:DNA-binding MarR family transcriptional regulator
MKLEEEIVTTKFYDEYHKAAVNILFNYHWINYQVGLHTKKYDLTPQQYNVLRIVRGQKTKSANLKLVTQRLLDRWSDVSRLIDNLVGKGYLEKEKNIFDKRNIVISLTERGAKVMKDLNVIDRLFERMFKLDENEVLELNNLLDKIRGDKPIRVFKALKNKSKIGETFSTPGISEVKKYARKVELAAV